MQVLMGTEQENKGHILQLEFSLGNRKDNFLQMDCDNPEIGDESEAFFPGNQLWLGHPLF
jgi:hypothetical protein